METELLSIKLGGIFAVTIVLAVIFAALYYHISNLTVIDAIYKSFSIQTIGGNQIDPKNDTEKAVICVQHFLAFMIISGLIVVSIKIPKTIENK